MGFFSGFFKEKSPKYTKSDIKNITDCANRFIEIINESLKISNESTVPNIKISRLELAKKTIIELKNLAVKFPFLTITNIDNVEINIKDFENNFKSSGLYDIANGNAKDAATLLKEATQLKKQKNFESACNKLREAYSAYGSEYLAIKDKLRLPMYLQLAGKSDDGWEEINKLNRTHTNVFDQLAISDQMRIFLQKDKKYKQAVIFSAWTICQRVKCDEFNLTSCIEMADNIATGDEYSPLLEFYNDGEIYGTTPKGNPIKDHAYKIFSRNFEESRTIDHTISSLRSGMKKAGWHDKIEKLSNSMHKYILENKDYSLIEVKHIVEKHTH